MPAAAGPRTSPLWRRTQPGMNGYTDSFYTEDNLPPTNPIVPATPSQRIDLVLVRSALTPLADAPSDTGTGAFHPSDHNGVVARVGVHHRDDD